MSQNNKNKLQQIRVQQDAENNAKVLRAVSELLHNQQTPNDLFEAVAGFVCEQSNKTDFHSEAILAKFFREVGSGRRN